MSIGLGPHLRMVSLGVLSHWCPACDARHVLHMRLGALEWDHNPKAPSFSQDIRQQVGDVICSYRITQGRVQFLPDATHILAGRTVDLPVYPHLQP